MPCAIAQQLQHSCSSFSPPLSPGTAASRLLSNTLRYYAASHLHT